MTHAASLKNVSHFVNKIILFFKLKILIFDFHTRIHNTDLSSIFPSIFMLALLMSEFSALLAGLKVFADTGVRSFSPRVAVLTLNMLSVVPRKGTRLSFFCFLMSIFFISISSNGDFAGRSLSRM